MRLVAALMIVMALAGCAAPDVPCRIAGFEGDNFVLCRYRAGKDEIRLASQGPAGPIGSLSNLERALGGDARRVTFAMNAGMYDDAQTPIGLIVEQGQASHPLNQADGQGNFFLKPNGVFWVDADGRPHIDETEAFAAMDAHPAWATQSGPLLLRRGVRNPHIADDGQSRQIRNGVCVLGHEAVFVISQRPVSFGRLARFFGQRLGCRDALYLDGAVSSLWAPTLGRKDDRPGLGTFVVVLRAVPKAERS